MASAEHSQRQLASQHILRTILVQVLGGHADRVLHSAGFLVDLRQLAPCGKGAGMIWAKNPHPVSHNLFTQTDRLSDPASLLVAAR